MTVQPDLVLTAHFAQDDTMTFRHIPFAVPAGISSLHLIVRYNDMIGSDPRLTNGNTLDIGVFDERGTDAGGPGFRGWSGSDKLDLMIGEKWSTPPYRAAPIGAGTWHLLLGAYKVGEHGLDAEIAIRFDAPVETPEPAPVPDVASLRRKALPPIARTGWYRGDLHAHTVYSDGSATPTELMVAAAEAGLDFIGITDHNRAISPVGTVPQGPDWPVLVPGVEVTTYAGHFNVWGTDTWYDFRDPTAEGLQAAIDAARADGGLVALNHPKPFGPDWEFPEVTGFDCLETWNGWWERLNTHALREWDRRLRAGQRLVGIGGSDVHHPGMIGDPAYPLSPARVGWPTLFVGVDAALTAPAILAAVRAGRCFVSESPAGPQVYIDHDADELRVQVVRAAGCALVLVGPDGVIAAIGLRNDDTTCRWPLWELPTTPWVRVEIHRSGGAIAALSNALWLDD